MGVVPDDVIKEKDEEIANLIKEIDGLVAELRKVSEESQRLELINKITEKERDLRAVRQVKGRLRAVLPKVQKLW
ncbi:MAG: hypothetical protein OCU20_06925 [Methanophagales archaeon]|nr:hypothetical protein [Methanophagales archaeon]MCW3139484.1 hypothetical protein [Methanophagales archaeon]MCW7070433.1 hypothetical protein [Methanophagales archaeon]MCW7073602.1 hypothetical protein [Methanophagales archaeon]